MQVLTRFFINIKKWPNHASLNNSYNQHSVHEVSLLKKKMTGLKCSSIFHHTLEKNRWTLLRCQNQCLNWSLVLLWIAALWFLVLRASLSNMSNSLLTSERTVKYRYRFIISLPVHPREALKCLLNSGNKTPKLRAKPRLIALHTAAEKHTTHDQRAILEPLTSKEPFHLFKSVFAVFSDLHLSWNLPDRKSVV